MTETNIVSPGEFIEWCEERDLEIVKGTDRIRGVVHGEIKTDNDILSYVEAGTQILVFRPEQRTMTIKTFLEDAHGIDEIEKSQQSQVFIGKCNMDFQENGVVFYGYSTDVQYIYQDNDSQTRIVQ